MEAMAAVLHDTGEVCELCYWKAERCDEAAGV